MSKAKDYPVMTEFDWLVEGRRAHAQRGERHDFFQLHGTTYMPEAFKRLHCPDGFNVSVQGSEFNYSTPRNNLGPYSEVELGLPKRITGHDREVLAPFAEYKWEGNRFEDMVYPYTPVGIIRELIFWHCIGRSSPGKHVILGVMLVLLTLLVALLA